MMTEKIKATRKLFNFDFEKEGAAVALVSKEQGGPANSRTTLLTKSTKDITTEDVTKASMVTVELSITEYLRRFFDLWYDDAILLAKIFGYDTDDEVMDSYEDYIQSKVDAVTIMKSVVLDKDADEIKKAIGELAPQDYLTILKSQEIFEKNFESAKANHVKAVKKSSEVSGGDLTSKGVNNPPSVDIKETNKEDVMSEFITKSAHESALTEAIEKAVAPLKADLAKATELVEAYKKEKQETINKARKDAISKVEADAEAAEELFKSLEPVSEEAFAAVMKSLQKKNEAVASSDLMSEVGDQGNSEAVEKAAAQGHGSRAAEILKAKYQKQGK